MRLECGTRRIRKNRRMEHLEVFHGFLQGDITGGALSRPDSCGGRFVSVSITTKARQPRPKCGILFIARYYIDRRTVLPSRYYRPMVGAIPSQEGSNTVVSLIALIYLSCLAFARERATVQAARSREKYETASASLPERQRELRIY